MYPLNVVLVGCPEELVPEILGEMFELEARVTARHPDIPSAVTRPSSAAAWTDGAVRPSSAQVFVVHLQHREDTRGLGWLMQTFAGSPVVALAGGADLSLPALALAQGATVVVPVPIRSGELRAALQEVAKPFAAAAGPPKVIAVAGVAGGVGATTLAVNLARELADGGRCLLVELTHRMGVVADLLNLTPQYTTRELADEGDRLDTYRVQRALVPAGGGLFILAAPPAAPSRRPVPAQELMRVVGLTRGLTGTVVVDVPATHDELYYSALAAADRVVLVGRQRVPTVRAWQVVVKTVLALSPSRKPSLVANRFDPHLEGLGVSELTRLLGKIVPHTVSNDPKSVAGAINRSKLIRDYAPDSPVTADLAALATALLTADGQPAERVPAALATGSGVVNGSSVVRMLQAFRRG
jgi:pilus assembly protein CpaE